jgi:UDP-N-acetylmuramoyl-L-alanyl-D-glutamate--2,6-diaminopimelate ligase
LAVDGVHFQAVTPVGRLELQLHLAGHFNVYNALGALGIGLTLGLDLPTIARGLEAVSGVPGRFQMVPGGQRFGVVVDYAHTPDGLDNVLRTARQLTPGRLIVVFGCGGDRDRGKRPLMGQVAAKYADAIFVTSDNPRSEDPISIIKEIEGGLAGAGKRSGEYRLIPDRAEAIRTAIAFAAPNDLVVIAGKGHETYQIFDDRTIHFDDREVAAAALEDRKHGILAGGS